MEGKSIARFRVTGAMLPNLVGRDVCVVGKVLNVASSGQRLRLRCVDGREVECNLVSQLQVSEPILSGYCSICTFCVLYEISKPSIKISNSATKSICFLSSCNMKFCLCEDILLEQPNLMISFTLIETFKWYVKLVAFQPGAAILSVELSDSWIEFTSSIYLDSPIFICSQYFLIIIKPNNKLSFYLTSRKSHLTKWLRAKHKTEEIMRCYFR